MSGGTSSANANYTEPGWATNVLVPLMRAVGLGIASRGGVLGPMLASGGDSIASYYQDKRDSAVASQLLKMLQPVMRSESTPGTPPQISALPSPLSAEADPEAFARVGTPGVESIPRPGTPPTRREWQGMPTQAEVLARIAGPEVPENLRGWVGLEALGIRGLWRDIERPQAVTEDLERAREAETRARREGTYTEALRTGSPEARGRALAEGAAIPERPPATKFVQRSDGTVQEVDARTGEPRGAPKPQRTEEQAEEVRSRPQRVAAMEQMLAQAVQAKEITLQEAWTARALLQQAKTDGNFKPFQDYIAKLSEARAKGTGRGAGSRKLDETVTDVPRRAITGDTALGNHQAGVTALATELAGALPAWKTSSVAEKIAAIQKAYLERNGVEVRVAPADAAGSSFKLVGAWEPAGKRKSKRSYEPPPERDTAEED